MVNCDLLDLQDETRIGGDTHDLNGSARRPMIGAPVSVHHFLDDVLICGDVLDEFGDLDDIDDFPASGLHGPFYSFHDSHGRRFSSEIEMVELGRVVRVAVRNRCTAGPRQEQYSAPAHADRGGERHVRTSRGFGSRNMYVLEMLIPHPAASEQQSDGGKTRGSWSALWVHC